MIFVLPVSHRGSYKTNPRTGIDDKIYSPSQNVDFEIQTPNLGFELLTLQIKFVWKTNVY